MKETRTLSAIIKRRRLLVAAGMLVLAASGLVASLPSGPAQADPPGSIGLQPGPRFTPPEIVTNLDGRREAFARGTKNEVYHARELCAGCGQWSQWDSMGANIWDHPVAARQADGRIVVFMWAQDNRIYHAKQRNPGSLEWDGWTQISDQSFNQVPVVTTNADGRLEIFSRLRWNSIPPPDFRVYHAWQVAPNGGWSSWAAVGGDFPQITGGHDSELIGAARNADGQLEIVAVGGDATSGGNLYSTRQSSFGAWTRLGGSTVEGQPKFGWRPFLVRGPDGRLHAFALIALNNIGTPNWRLAHLWQNSPGGSWSAPALMPGTENFSSIKYVTTGADGRIEIGAVDPDYVERRAVQAGSSNDFGPWQPDSVADVPAQSVAEADVIAGRYTLSAVNTGTCLEVGALSTADNAAVRHAGCNDMASQQWQIEPHPNGGYTLAAVNSGKCLEIAGESTASGARAQQRVCSTGARNQNWRLDRQPDGTYALVARHSEKCLEALSDAQGAFADQSICASVPYQRFRLAPAGRYMLVADHSGQCLDVNGWSTADGAFVDQWHCQDADTLRWRLLVEANGMARVVGAHSGKCLEVAGGNADGATVTQRTCSIGLNQRWRLDQQLDGTYTLTAMHSGKCLDVSGASQDIGAQVYQWSCNGQANQKWRLVPAGSFTVTARHSGKCLDVPGSQTNDGARVEQQACNGATNQQWRMAAGHNSGVTLVAAHSGKCLDVAGQSQSDGAQVWQWTCIGGAANQRWYLGPNGDGSRSLMAGHSQKCLEIFGAVTDSGVSADQWDCVPDATNELWRLTPVPDPWQPIIVLLPGQ
jgi:Ricin-type beta-trefoil lectin domain-like